MLRENEFTPEEIAFEDIDIHGEGRSIDLPTHSVGYTFCQMPIVDIDSDDDEVEIAYSGDRVRKIHTPDCRTKD